MPIGLIWMAGIAATAHFGLLENMAGALNVCVFLAWLLTPFSLLCLIDAAVKARATHRWPGRLWIESALLVYAGVLLVMHGWFITGLVMALHLLLNATQDAAAKLHAERQAAMPTIVVPPEAQR